MTRPGGCLHLVVHGGDVERVRARVAAGDTVVALSGPAAYALSAAGVAHRLAAEYGEIESWADAHTEIARFLASRGAGDESVDDLWRGFFAGEMAHHHLLGGLVLRVVAAERPVRAVVWLRAAGPAVAARHAGLARALAVAGVVHDVV